MQVMQDITPLQVSEESHLRVTPHMHVGRRSGLAIRALRGATVHHHHSSRPPRIGSLIVKDDDSTYLARWKGWSATIARTLIHYLTADV